MPNKFKGPTAATATDIQNGQALEEQETQRTLSDVITKMKQISKDQYDSKTYDNIYSIFMQLAVQEKRILLKGFINLFFIIEDKVADNTLASVDASSADTVKAVNKSILTAEEHITDNITQIELYNQKEMIRLKSRLTTIIVVSLVIGVIAMMITATFLSSSKTETLGIFSEFGKIIAEVLGL